MRYPPRTHQKPHTRRAPSSACAALVARCRLADEGCSYRNPQAKKGAHQFREQVAPH